MKDLREKIQVRAVLGIKCFSLLTHVENESRLAAACSDELIAYEWTTEHQRKRIWKSWTAGKNLEGWCQVWSENGSNWEQNWDKNGCSGARNEANSRRFVTARLEQEAQLIGRILEELGIRDAYFNCEIHWNFGELRKAWVKKNGK